VGGGRHDYSEGTILGKKRWGPVGALWTSGPNGGGRPHPAPDATTLIIIIGIYFMYSKNIQFVWYLTKGSIRNLRLEYLMIILEVLVKLGTTTPWRTIITYYGFALSEIFSPLALPR